MERMVTSSVVFGMVALGIAGGVMAQETKTLQGEIVDPASYLKDGRHGLEMEDETYEAVDGGQTLALLENGTGNLYLLLGEEAGEDPNELAYDYVNTEVTVTGIVYERGGLRGIVATSIEPLNAPQAPSEPSAVPPAPEPVLEPVDD
ncbi:MAG: hypothetical protein HY353_02385 [Candidatus Omnitrophica bacterium]|nr:hypothetical protein [Candidatus Omnitrophota bacterium]